MKSLVIIGAVIAYAYAQGRGAASSDKDAKIISQTADVNIDGSYQWSFEADNGISAKESGQLKNDIEEAQGEFKYTAPDGSPIQITYTANEGGFQPQGAHIPVPPPIPEAIQKSLDWNAAHPEEESGGKSRKP